MSMAANASFAGRPFRLDPMSIDWSFNSKVADLNTVGGKVIQVFGTKMGDLVVSGSFGKGGWEEQAAFLKDMKTIADRSVADPTANPPHFRYPDKSWDFLVYLKEYSTPDGGRSVVLDNEIFAPKWTLTFHVVEDNSGLKTIAQDSYLSRIALGLGWKQTEFNGPMGVWSDNNSQSIEDYLAAQFGLGGQVSTGNQDAGTSTSGAGTSGSNVPDIPAGAPVAGDTGVLNVATCNIRNTPDLPRASVVQAATVAGAHADLIGFQEIAEAEDVSDVESGLGSNFAVAHPDRENAMAAHRGKWTVVSVGSTLAHGGDPGVSPDRYVAHMVVKPVDGSTPPFALVNTHFVANAWDGKSANVAEAQRFWNTHFGVLQNVVAGLAQNYTVFITGDFNRPPDGVPEVIPGQRWIISHTIDKIGLYEHPTGMKAKLTGTGTYGTPSDHDLVVARFEIS